jgi:MOSC domain-containing protein
MESARIETLYRYPVKSMQGETLAASAIGERGLLGDRAYALIDRETGKVASAKNPRRWRVLFECRAEFVAEPPDGADLPPVRITLPDGATIGSDDPGVDDALSRVVDRPVTLESRPPEGAMLEQYRLPVDGVPDPHDDTVTDELMALAAPGTFFDAAPLHVVTTATLSHLAGLAPQSAFSPARFRPNVVVAVDGDPGFVENDWVNHAMRLGADVQASVFLAAPRCVMTTLAQPDLPRDPGVLQAIARHNRFDIPGLGPSSCVGVYALVTAGGTASCGDAVEIA